jgi:tRNA uridine 5-carbamoylmethylation protein Kti12
MATCYVLVGAPAVGKSTRVKQMVEMDRDAYVYSTDAELELIALALGKTYNDVFESQYKNAVKIAEEGLVFALQDKRDVIWDQTNMGVNKRAVIVERMKKNAYDIICECYLHPSVADVDDWANWQTRLVSRPGKTIPGFVITNMTKSFVLPDFAEGFDDIRIFDMYGDALL